MTLYVDFILVVCVLLPGGCSKQADHVCYVWPLNISAKIIFTSTVFYTEVALKLFCFSNVWRTMRCLFGDQARRSQPH